MALDPRRIAVIAVELHLSAGTVVELADMAGASPGPDSWQCSDIGESPSAGPGLLPPSTGRRR